MAETRILSQIGKELPEVPIETNVEDSRSADVDEEEETPDRALFDAISDDDVQAVEAALRLGGNPNRSYIAGTIFQLASSREAIRLLYAYGAAVHRVKMSDPCRGLFVGLSGLGIGDEFYDDPLDNVTREQFDQGRTRRFGVSNPEKMDVPLWNAMVEARCCSWKAREKFLNDNEGNEDGNTTADPTTIFGNPVWCIDRWGQSLTLLPDGTMVQIGGEHEDHYDPDFVIYNDVIVHHHLSTPVTPLFDIYGYPKDVFQPTDFHSATFVPVKNAIFIIGCMGHDTQKARDSQRLGETPVYKLVVGSWKMKTVVTTGDRPGWIYQHSARLVGNTIEIWADDHPIDNMRAKRWIFEDGELMEINILEDEKWILNVDTLEWRGP